MNISTVGDFKKGTNPIHVSWNIVEVMWHGCFVIIQYGIIVQSFIKLEGTKDQQNYK